MTKVKVTPWDVSGEVNYDKLIEEFGVQYIGNEEREYIEKLAREKGMENHLFLKRGLFFAQMDLKKVVDAHKNGEKIFLYTGRAPGGSMHIAHLIPFLFTKFLQEILDANLYIQIPDDEKFLFKKDLTREKIKEMGDSDLIDISAIGFDPDKTFIFRNTEYIKNMYGMYLNIARRLTFSQARNTFGFSNDSNVGMIYYPALQMVPTFFENNFCLIPCGIDQNPYFLLQRDFAEKLGFKKNCTILSKFLTSLKGPEGKMSASDPNNAILLTDTPDVVKKKINKYAYSGGKETLEEHRKHGGDTKVDVAYQWLYHLFEEDDEEIEKLKKGYESGEILSGEMKAKLIEKVNKFLESHNRERGKIEKENLLDKYLYTGKLAKEMWNKIH